MHALSSGCRGSVADTIPDRKEVRSVGLMRQQDGSIRVFKNTTGRSSEDEFPDP